MANKSYIDLLAISTSPSYFLENRRFSKVPHPNKLDCIGLVP